MILIGIQETNLDFNIINLVWNIYNTPNFGSLFCDVGATFLKRVSGAGNCGFGHIYFKKKSLMENLIYDTVTIKQNIYTKLI